MQVRQRFNLKLETALNFKLLPMLGLAILLAACSGDEGDDLDQFMRDAGKDMKPNIKPLPEVKPYVALEYNADGTLIDPFHARKSASKDGSKRPDENRPKEQLESYPLESLKYVGMLSKNKLTYALLRTPDNTIQQAKAGNYAGQNYGRITRISDSEVVLTEIVQDELSGDWVERVSTLTLQE